VNTKESRQVCVVLDTNLWISNLMMRRGLGASLLHSLNRVGGYLGFPEVVEREMTKHMVRVGLEANEEIKKHFDTIGMLTGSKPRYPSLPTEEKFHRCVLDRLTELSKLLRRVPFTLDHAKSALDRVLLGLPPNGPKNQQFKDSAIWEAILDLSTSYKIYFITKDNGFFKNRKPDMGLAENLLEDCSNVGEEVLAYNDLASCLNAITEQMPPLDHQKIAIAIEKVVNRGLANQAAKRSFQIGELVDKVISHFPTENPDLVGIKFALTYEISDVSQPRDEERIEASLTASGDCIYDIIRDSASDIHFDEVGFKWQDSDGEIHKSKNIFLRVDSSLVLTSSVGS